MEKQTAIKQWVANYTDELYKWAFYKLSSKELAEDLVQETFIAAFHHFDSFENRSQPKTWLFRILNNKIIDHYRSNRQKFTQPLEEEKAYTAADNFFDEQEHWKRIEVHKNWQQEDTHLLDNEEFLKILDECIGHLPEKWQIAIQSKYVLNKKAQEICQEIDITLSNYWQIIHRAKLLLKHCIEAKW